jgi:hypothetical protein
MEKLQKLTIAGKNVYVFDDSATALLAWVDDRRENSN